MFVNLSSEKGIRSLRKLNNGASLVWNQIKVQGLTHICLKKTLPIYSKGYSGFVQNQCQKAQLGRQSVQRVILALYKISVKGLN